MVGLCDELIGFRIVFFVIHFFVILFLYGGLLLGCLAMIDNIIDKRASTEKRILSSIALCVMGYFIYDGVIYLLNHVNLF